METTFLKTCGASVAALALGLSLAATPVMAAGPGGARPGGGGMHGGGMAARPGGGMHGGGMARAGGGGWHGGGMAARPGGGWQGGGVAARPGGGWQGGVRHGAGWRGRYAGGYGGYGGGYGGYGNGYGYDYGIGGAALGLGLLGGAIIGSQYPYYDSDYGYGAGYVTYPVAGDDSVAYCMRRFRSYDPTSGTYLGYDGFRHPCP